MLVVEQLVDATLDLTHRGGQRVLDATLGRELRGGPVDKDATFERKLRGKLERDGQSTPLGRSRRERFRVRETGCNPLQDAGAPH